MPIFLYLSSGAKRGTEWSDRSTCSLRGRRHGWFFWLLPLLENGLALFVQGEAVTVAAEFSGNVDVGGADEGVDAG